MFATKIDTLCRYTVISPDEHISMILISPTQIIMNHNQIIIANVACIATYTHHSFHV